MQFNDIIKDSIMKSNKSRDILWNESLFLKKHYVEEINIDNILC